ncbi:MAG: hypothetical protein K9K67_07015 [Bacteriovoracaceae bacterium]|nr:hypothetical protein [Bacteriovoracaceae bacterium]
MELPKAIIVDIDGTLADVEHRVHHVTKNPKDWHAFHKNLVNDTPQVWCRDLIEIYFSQGINILLLTGRGEEYLEETKKWLLKHLVPYKSLFMRGINDRREDSVVKKEIFQEHISPFYEVSFVIEDRQSVVEMWRGLGLTCLQCAKGDF